MNKELSISIEDIKEELKKSAEELVKNEVKTQFVTWIGEKALPVAKELAINYTEALKASANPNFGWLRFRDIVFLPLLIQFGLWFVETTIKRIQEEV